MSRRTCSSRSASPATREGNCIPRATHPSPGAEGEDRTPRPGGRGQTALLCWQRPASWELGVEKSRVRRCSGVRRRGGRFHSGGTEQNVYVATIVVHKFGVCDTGIGGGIARDEPQAG